MLDEQKVVLPVNLNATQKDILKNLLAKEIQMNSEKIWAMPEASENPTLAGKTAMLATILIALL